MLKVTPLSPPPATATATPTALDTSLPSNPSSTTHSPMSAVSSSVDSTSSTGSSTCSCNNCGAVMPVVSEADFPREAQLRIEELEQQIKEFSVRAVMAAENLEKSQRQVMELRRKSENSNAPSSPPRTNTANSISNTMQNTMQNFQRVGSNRFNNFFMTRSNSTTSQPANRPATPETLERASIESQVLTDLSNQLCEERRQRETAEKQLADVKGELEDLSMTLFQQANEMVSTERKARAKLEERVTLLEKRDAEKKARLDRLEKGLERINRVRNLLDKKT